MVGGGERLTKHLFCELTLLYTIRKHIYKAVENLFSYLHFADTLAQHLYHKKTAVKYWLADIFFFFFNFQKIVIFDPFIKIIFFCFKVGVWSCHEKLKNRNRRFPCRGLRDSFSFGSSHTHAKLILVHYIMRYWGEGGGGWGYI